MSRCLRLSGFMALGLAIFAGRPGQARADGEVGLVVETAGVATTYCIAYSGDGITGEELLRRAGYSIEQFGGSGGRTVCAIGETGCKDASSFTSCFCQCQGASCIYWAFFTREYGKNWVYSALAFNLRKADDGDLHGWRWGAGGPNSAPAPVDLTFEQVCGHAPRGGVAPTATAEPATAVPVITLAPASPSPAATAAEPPPLTAAATIAATAAVPTVTVTIAGGPTPGGGAITLVRGETPIATGASVPAEDGNGGGVSAGIVAFAAVAGALLAATAGALAWRARRGG